MRVLCSFSYLLADI
uniref:Uncharacterized protein n=1 Tax=Arundo donax TaxID=35708 RepID=A0A0A9AFB7_ARUDO